MGVLPGRVPGPAGALRGPLAVPCGQAPVLDSGIFGSGIFGGEVPGDAGLGSGLGGDGLGGDGLGGDGLGGFRGARSAVGDRATVGAAVTDRRDAVPAGSPWASCRPVRSSNSARCRIMASLSCSVLAESARRPSVVR